MVSKNSLYLILEKEHDMATEWLIGFALLSLPLLAGFGLLFFMMSGKGKPSATQDILEDEKARRRISD
jgi:hypothetical protein